MGSAPSAPLRDAHGTLAVYKSGCCCDLCRAANRDYVRAARERARVLAGEPTYDQIRRELNSALSHKGRLRRERDEARDSAQMWQLRYQALKSGRVAA